MSVGANISANGIVFSGLDSAGYTIGSLANSSLAVYSGGVTVQTGAGNASFANSVGVILASSQTWANNSTVSALVIYGNVTSISAGAETLAFGGLGTTTVDGVVSGNIQLTQNGSGTTTLAGANTFGSSTSGSVVSITTGTLVVMADANLGAAPSNPQSAAITINGGAFNAAGTFALASNRGILIGASGGTISASAGDTLTFAGAISGGGSLTIQGSGAEIFSGASSFNGATIVNGGTLTLSGANATGGPLTLANEGTINLNYASNNGSKMAVGLLSLGGSLNLTPNSAGTNQTLASSVNLLANTTSQIIVANGTANSNYILATGSGTINRAAGSTVNFNIGQHATLTVATGAAGNLQNDSTGIIGGWATVSGTSWASVNASGQIAPFSGSTNVANTWAPGNNTYVSGSDTVPAGSTTNSFNVGGQLLVSLTGTNTITSGGILIANNGAGDSGEIQGGALTSGNGKDLIVQDFYPLAPFMLQTAIVDNGSTSIGFTKSGPGTVQLTANGNTYTGPTVVSGGGLVLYAPLPATSSVTIAAGASIETILTSTATVFGSLSGGGTVTGYPGNQFVISVGGDNTSTTFSGSITETPPNSPNSQIGVVKIGSGTWTVSGVNNYSQGTGIDGGTVRLGGNGTLGSPSGPVGVTGAALDLNGVNLGVGELQGGAGGLIVNNASGTAAILTVGNGNATGGVFPGIIADHSTGSGVLSLVKTGSGTQTLSGANIYSGGTTIAAGALLVNGATGSLAAGSQLTFNNAGTFNYQSAAAGSSQSLGVLTLAAGDATIQSTAGTSGVAALNFASDARAPGATATFLASGGTNGISNRITLANATPNSIIDQGTFASTGNGANYAWTDAAGYVRPINYIADAGAAYSAGGPNVAGTFVQTSGPIAAEGTAALTTLNINAPTAASGAFTLGSAATLTVSGILKTGGGGPYNGAVISGGAAIQPAVNAELVVRADQSTDTLAINTPITANGFNPLTISGAGTVILGAANTHSGGTFVNGASLELANANAVQNSTVWLNGAGGLLFAPSIGQFNAGGLAGSINLALADTAGNAVTLQVGANNDSTTYSGIISGAGGMAKTGTGTLTLAAANTYSGPTSLLNGTLQLSNSQAAKNSSVTLQSGVSLAFAPGIGSFSVGSLAGSANIVLDDLAGNAVTLQVGNNNASSTYSGVLSGSGILYKSGSGVLTLPGANTYTGGTQFAGGVVNISSDAAFGTPPTAPAVNLNFLSSATLQFAGDFTTTPLNANRTISTADSGVVVAFDTQSFTVDYGGAFTGNGLLKKLGAGTLVLGGTIAPTNCIIQQGTLELNANTGSLGVNSSVTFVDTGTFLYQAKASGSTLSLYGVTQTTGNGTAAAGDWTIECAYGGSGNAGISLSNSTGRQAGDTVNYVVAQGVNGSSNKIAIGQTATNSFIDQGTFFGNLAGGDNFAWYDAGGFVRAINYAGDAGAISSPGGVSVAGTFVQTTGAITSQATATFTSLNINSASASAGVFSLASGATLTVNGVLKTGGGGVANTAVISGGTAIQAAANAEMVVRTDQSSDALTIATPIVANGRSSLTVSGPGIVTLAAANTYSGGTVLNAGTLQMSAGGTLGSSAGNVTINAGTLDLNGTNQSVGLLTGQGTIVNNAPSTQSVLTIGNGSSGASGTYSGVISDGLSGGGTVALGKAGNSTETLTGYNTYSGGTTISSGFLSVGAISDSSFSNIGNSTGGANNELTIAGGFLRYTGPSTSTARNILATSSGGIGASSGVNLTLSGTISGTGQIQYNSGTITVSGANTYSGGTIDGATLVANGPATTTASSTGTGNVTDNGVLTGSGSVLPLNNTGLSVTVTQGAIVGASGATLTINGPLKYNVTFGSASSTFVLNSAGVNNLAPLIASNGLSVSGPETNSVFISGSVADGTYDLFSFPPGTGPNAASFTLQSRAPTGQVWALVNNSTTNATQIDLVVGDTASSRTTLASNSGGSSSFGPAVQWSVIKSGTYANLQSSAIGVAGGGAGALLNDTHGSPLTAAMLLGSNSGNFAGTVATVSMSWRTPTTFESPTFISNVLNLSGMSSASGEPVQTDPFVLEMEYNPARFSNEVAAAKAKQIYLAWLNPNVGGGVWQNAVTGDFSGTGIGNLLNSGMLDFQGSFTSLQGQNNISSSNLASYVGAWGVDTTNHEVWAIIDHNSSFAAVPEPSQLILFGLGAFGISAIALARRGLFHGSLTRQKNRVIRRAG